MPSYTDDAVGNEAHPSLAYGRIAQNRRNSVLIAVVLVTALAPFVLGVSYLLTTRLIRIAGSQTGYLSKLVRVDEEALRMPDQSAAEPLEWRQADLDRHRAALAQSRQADWSLIIKLMPCSSAPSWPLWVFCFGEPTRTPPPACWLN
jgi:hypothetical protein